MFAVEYRNTMRGAKLRAAPPVPLVDVEAQQRAFERRQRELAQQREREMEEMARRERAVEKAWQEIHAIAAYRIREIGREGDVTEIPQRRSAKSIIETVATAYGVTPADITGASRSRSIVAVRFAAIRAVADARPDMSLPAIGRIFNRDHTTIIHALRKTKQPGQAR